MLLPVLLLTLMHPFFACLPAFPCRASQTAAPRAGPCCWATQPLSTRLRRQLWASCATGLSRLRWPSAARATVPPAEGSSAAPRCPPHPPAFESAPGAGTTEAAAPVARPLKRTRAPGPPASRRHRRATGTRPWPAVRTCMGPSALLLKHRSCLLDSVAGPAPPAACTAPALGRASKVVTVIESDIFAGVDEASRAATRC
jgi:hypothetical protein